LTATRPETAANGCLASYSAEPGRYDELLDVAGELRPHWRPLIDRITGVDARANARRALDLTRRLIVENGVTYNVYADPQGADRPWTLDPIPLVLTSAEWRTIEKGLAQRARLMNALLADLYGPQRLLAEGIVPPELVFGHPNFLWPCLGISPRKDNWLQIYAADLARAPDGQWWVMADRTQTPSGAGYALENREILKEVLPDTFAELHARRIDGFFGELRGRLLDGAEGDETPLAVILTPGPFNETYFEHAYLARQMGLPLVEGTDLTVRQDTVYLKTVAGLRRVHAIFRRLDDDYCDPVELRSDSALGVAGLLGAVRAGRVQVANALGSGVLESAGWLGFLPRIAARLLGETLELPTLATWWCGEGPALDYVLAHLDRLVIKPMWPNQRFEPVFGRSLTGEARTRLIERLRTRPHAYVAQEHLSLSQAPVWRPYGALGFAAKAISIRVYATASNTGHLVMPGGLARMAIERPAREFPAGATDTSVDVVSTQRGGGSKDIWVLARTTHGPADPDHEESVETPRTTSRLTVRYEEIPSRLVENLFWFGRYCVRCEDKTCLLRATLGARINETVWKTAVGICRDIGLIAPDTEPTGSLRDDRNSQGVVADVRRLAWCASQVRGRLSSGYWRAISDMQRRLQDGLTARDEPRAILDRLSLSLAALAGFSLDDMTQDAGWRLLRIGRRLERLQFAAGLLAHYISAAAATRQRHVEWLLEAHDSLRIYRARYAVTTQLGPALDLLIRDTEHPTALAFLSRSLARDLVALSGALGRSNSGTADDELEEAIPSLSDAELLSLEANDEKGEHARLSLAARLRALATAAGALSDRLSMRHFAHISLDSQALAT
jgi:uncharacterized circularly permuted ATP-grasp superfamily protein/uncharacterized alpha-E superfamily protein